MTEYQGPSRAVSEQVKQFRQGRWSAREFAAECRRRGADQITENVMENIERTRRPRDITIDELLLFAEVLEVPPLRLLMPREGARLRITEDVSADAAQLALWFTGKAPVSGLPKVRFTRAAAEVTLYLDAYDEIEAAKDADRAGLAEQRDAALRRLARLTAAMTAVGVEPPRMPDAFAKRMVEL